jgi:CPA2 family monovalent cation:H+ antiporter-2
VLEVNVDTIRKARVAGEPMIYGDITRKDVLLRAGIDCAKVIVFAISDNMATRIAIRMVREINPLIFILIRTRYAAEVDELYKLGANQVIPEEFETSIEIFSRVLHEYHIPGNIIANQIQLVRFEGYKMLRGFSLDQENIGRVAALFAGATVDNIQLQPGSPAVGRTLKELDIRHATGGSVIAIARNGEAITNPGPDLVLQPDSPAIGRTLKELDIRRASGATVIAVVRNGEATTNPGPDYKLQTDDILVLLGAHRDLDAATTLLTQRGAARE